MRFLGEIDKYIQECQVVHVVREEKLTEICSLHGEIGPKSIEMEEGAEEDEVASLPCFISIIESSRRSFSFLPGLPVLRRLLFTITRV